MANDFYTKTSAPSTGSQGSSATMRAEFALIETGFNKMPSLTGNASKLVQVNSGASALEATTTPTLGTPASGTLTNCTGYPVASLSGLAAGVAAFLATPNSANLRTAMTDESGSGALLFASGALGTPSSGTLTSCTGLPISTGVSGLGAGVATFLGTPSSANLRSAVTEGGTGTGAIVCAASPTGSGAWNISDTGTTPNLTVKTTTTGSTNAAALTVQRGDQASGFAQTSYNTGASTVWQTGLRSGDDSYHIYNGTNDRFILTQAGALSGVTSLAMGGALSGVTTLAASGDVAINTNKFNITAASGNTTIAGTLGLTSDFAINTNKFTVAAASGNTVIAGTVNATGTVQTAGSVLATGTVLSQSTLQAMSATATPAGGSSAVTIGSAAIGIYWGSGAPTVSAVQGSLYLRTNGSSTSTRAYINTDGATTWTAITTVA